MNKKIYLSIALLILCPLNAGGGENPPQLTDTEPVNPYAQGADESNDERNARLMRMTWVLHPKEKQAAEAYKEWKKKQEAIAAHQLLVKALEEAPQFVLSLGGGDENFEALNPKGTIKLANRALKLQRAQEEDRARVKERLEQEDAERAACAKEYERNLLDYQQLEIDINEGKSGNHAKKYDLKDAIREHETGVRQPGHEARAAN